MDIFTLVVQISDLTICILEHCVLHILFLPPLYKPFTQCSATVSTGWQAETFR